MTKFLFSFIINFLIFIIIHKAKSTDNGSLCIFIYCGLYSWHDIPLKILRFSVLVRIYIKVF